MKLKKYCRFQLDLKSKWLRIGTLFMCAAFFLRFVYQFALTNCLELSFGGWIFDAILPVAICVAYFVLLGVIKLNAPGLFAVLGGALCFLLMIWSFTNPEPIQVFLGVIFYLMSGAVLVMTVAGYLPSKYWSAVVFGVILISRILLVGLGSTGVFGWFRECSIYCTIAALLCLPLTLKEVRNKTVKKA